MNKMDYKVCCPECLKGIGMRSTTAAKIWMELCAFSVKKNGDVYVLGGFLEDELELLENMGFLVSFEDPRENNGNILVRINNKENNFCIGNHD